MRWRDIPNIISLMRIGLVLPIVMLLIEEHYTTALIMLFVAGASDALDGYLARRYKQITVLGRILDPFVDKVIVCGSFVFLLEKQGESDSV